MGDDVDIVVTGILHDRLAHVAGGDTAVRDVVVRLNPRRSIGGNLGVLFAERLLSGLLELDDLNIDVETVTLEHRNHIEEVLSVAAAVVGFAGVPEGNQHTELSSPVEE